MKYLLDREHFSLKTSEMQYNIAWVACLLDGKILACNFIMEIVQYTYS